MKKSDVVLLGLNVGVVATLSGGLMFGIGLSLVSAGAHIGWLLLLPAAPVGGMLGIWLAKRAAKGLQ